MTHLQRTYLITGSTGIAEATAKLASTTGARLFVVSRTEANCQALTDAITANGGICAYYAADLKNAEAVEAAVAACVAQYGRIDGLFNVAGISGRKFGDGPLHECTEEGWDITMDTNVRSMFLVCRAVLKQMLDQEPDAQGLRGGILNMASVLGFSPEPHFFATHAYAASKGAIISLSKSMASYYAPHKIRVNVIAPSLIRTPMSARAQHNPDILGLMKTKQPLCEDLIDADEVAKAARFLMSGDSSMITGNVLTVDAGWCVS